MDYARRLSSCAIDSIKSIVHYNNDDLYDNLLMLRTPPGAAASFLPLVNVPAHIDCALFLLPSVTLSMIHHISTCIINPFMYSSYTGTNSIL